MKIVICGPNLNTIREAFHVHAEGCADLRNYGRGKKMGGDDQGWTIEVESAEVASFEASKAVYEDHVSDYGWNEDDNPNECAQYWRECETDFHVFGCVAKKGGK